MNEDLMRMSDQANFKRGVEVYSKNKPEPKKPIEAIGNKKTSDSTEDPMRDPRENPEKNPPHPSHLGNNIDIKDKDPKEKGPKAKNDLLGNIIDLKA